MAGICIGIGGVIYLTTEDHVVGGVLFSLGLLTIYSFGFNLYTGKCCTFLENPKKNIMLILNSLIGNFIGTALVGYTLRLSELSIIEKSVEAVEGKFSHSLLATFILAIFCGIMMSIAVLGYKKQTSDFGRFIIIALPVTIFIAAKFEHSIADMFYISLANKWSISALIFILVCAAGNFVGCNIISVAEKITSK